MLTASGSWCVLPVVAFYPVLDTLLRPTSATPSIKSNQEAGT